MWSGGPHLNSPIIAQWNRLTNYCFRIEQWIWIRLEHSWVCPWVFSGHSKVANKREQVFGLSLVRNKRLTLRQEAFTYNARNICASAVGVRRPVREWHLSGLTWQGGRHKNVPWLGAGVMFSKLFPKPSDGGGTWHPQCLHCFLFSLCMLSVETVKCAVHFLQVSSKRVRRTNTSCRAPRWNCPSGWRARSTRGKPCLLVTLRVSHETD